MEYIVIASIVLTIVIIIGIFSSPRTSHKMYKKQPVIVSPSYSMTSSSYSTTSPSYYPRHHHHRHYPPPSPPPSPRPPSPSPPPAGCPPGYLGCGGHGQRWHHL